MQLTAPARYDDRIEYCGLTFGRYHYENDTDMKPILWRLLSVDNDRLLLLSDKGIGCMAYDKNTYSCPENATTWETCSLRKWLNGEFLNTAFTQEEREAILPTPLKNRNSYFSTRA